jgi:hypothetical protein
MTRALRWRPRSVCWIRMFAHIKAIVFEAGIAALSNLLNNAALPVKTQLYTSTVVSMPDRKECSENKSDSFGRCYSHLGMKCTSQTEPRGPYGRTMPTRAAHNSCIMSHESSTQYSVSALSIGCQPTSSQQQFQFYQREVLWISSCNRWMQVLIAAIINPRHPIKRQ